MAFISTRTKTWGFGDTIDNLNGVSERIEDYKPVFREIRDELSDAWRRNFLTNGSLVGGWAPLDKEYGSWKSINFPGAPPMIRSGELFRSLSSLRGRPNDIDDKKATFGTNVEYAKFHQYGTSNMPKREIVFEPAGFARKVAKMMSEHIVQGRNDGRAES